MLLSDLVIFLSSTCKLRSNAVLGSKSQSICYGTILQRLFVELLFFGLLEEEALHCFVHSGILEHVVFLSEELQKKDSPKSLAGI